MCLYVSFYESTHRFGGRHLTNLCSESFWWLDRRLRRDDVTAGMRCLRRLAGCFSTTPPLRCRRRHGEHRREKGVWDSGLQQRCQTSVSHVYQAWYSRVLLLLAGIIAFGACLVKMSAVAGHLGPECHHEAANCQASWMWTVATW